MPLSYEAFLVSKIPTFSFPVFPTYSIASLMASLESDKPEGPYSATDLEQVTLLPSALISSP